LALSYESSALFPALVSIFLIAVRSDLKVMSSSFPGGIPPGIRPPNPIWSTLEPTNGGGILSFYHSDSNSKIPVRDITRKGDSKSDPNLETMTYGLFSTCEQEMRKGLVEKGKEYIFFCTNRENVRVLTGYYHIRWYHIGPPLKHRGNRPDYWLAADETRFVTPGFPLRDLKGYLRGVRLDKYFRTFLRIDEQTVQRLFSLLRDTKEATEEYLREIKKLEGGNLKKYGVTYTNWKKREGFDWDWARKYLGKSR